MRRVLVVLGVAVLIPAGALLAWTAARGASTCADDEARATADRFARAVLAGDVARAATYLAADPAQLERDFAQLPRAGMRERDEVVSRGREDGGFCTSVGGDADTCVAYPTRVTPTHGGFLHVSVSCERREWKVVGYS